MSWIAAVAGILGGTAQGAMQMVAQGDATKAQSEASAAALQFQKDQWEQTRRDQAPWLAAGQAALPQLSRLAGASGNIDPRTDPGYMHKTSLADPGQFSFSTTSPYADPSYTWRLNQGLAAVDSSAAARGGFFSGNTGKALMDYGQGAASQEYQNQFDRYQNMLNDYMSQETFNSDQYNLGYNRQMGMNQNQYNQYASIAGLGQTALNQMQTSGQNYANNSGNIAMNQGNNIANGYINNGNTAGNMVNNATNQFMSYWGQQQQQNALNQPTVYDYQVNDRAINNMKLN